MTPQAVATVAPAAAQPTSIGAELHRIAVFDGHLYAAYGDYGANTGPLDIVSLDLATQTVGGSDVTLQTEELWQLLVAGGKLYAPFVDPVGLGVAESGQLAIATAAGSWSVVTSMDPVPVHVFDAAVLGTDLFVCGATDDSATVRRSTDAGATWTTVYSSGGATGDGDRTYRMWQTGTDLFAFPQTASGGKVLRWDGGAFTDITADMVLPIAGIPHDGVPLVFDDGGTLVPLFLGVSFWRASGLVVGSVGTVYLRPEDEAHRAAVEAALPPSDTFYLDGYTDPVTGDQYLLGGNGFLGVWRSQANGPFTHLFNLTGVNAVSLAVDPVGGFLYFGTTDSRILRTAIPA